MSEVQRWLIQKTPIGTMMKPNPDGNWIAGEDFDRVTAERDAALWRVAELESSFDELAASVGFSVARLDQTGDSPVDCANQLQHLLTAADERADLLEGLLWTWRNGCEMTVEAWAARRDKTDAALKPAEPPLTEGWQGVDCEENNREPGINVRFYPAIQFGSGFDIFSYGCTEGALRPMTFISMSDHKCPNKSYAVKAITRGTKSPCGILVNGIIYYCEDCKK